jgi:hypothetical protein
MNKTALWTFLLLVCGVLIGLLIYSDYFGNVKMQDTASDLLKVAIGAFVGAWANEISK